MSRKRASEQEMAASASVPTRRKVVSPRAKRTATPVAALPDAASAPEPVQQLPPREEIARLAYSYWEARGCQGGCPEEDWLRAEQELASTQPLVVSATA